MCVCRCRVPGTATATADTHADSDKCLANNNKSLSTSSSSNGAGHVAHTGVDVDIHIVNNRPKATDDVVGRTRCWQAFPFRSRSSSLSSSRGVYTVQTLARICAPENTHCVRCSIVPILVHNVFIHYCTLCSTASVIQLQVAIIMVTYLIHVFPN